MYNRNTEPRSFRRNNTGSVAVDRKGKVRFRFCAVDRSICGWIYHDVRRKRHESLIDEVGAQNVDLGSAATADHDVWINGRCLMQ
jgi:hypothetical protein